ncbi:MAG: hypothetical protein AAGD34_02240 [Pseudomonadota bacterium]
MTKRLFTALHRAAKTDLTGEDACTKALARALTDGAGVEEAEAARAALDTLPEDTRNRLLAQAHLSMRTDLSAFGIAPDRTPPPKGTRLN